MRWSQSSLTINNFGDAINPDLFHKISGFKVVNHKSVYRLFSPVYLFIGSNLDGLRIKNSIICGSGFKSDKSDIKIKPRKVIAVRGPLTQKKLKEYGVSCPDVFCDPGLLVSKFYPRTGIQKKFDIGIIPHYVDKKALEGIQLISHSLTYTILDIESPREELLTKINECKVIVSSSLHGIITAHSYQIPAMWIRLTDQIIGGDFKFQDYYQSLGVFDEKVHVVSKSLDLEYVNSKAKCYPCESNKKKFLEAMNEHFKALNSSL